MAISGEGTAANPYIVETWEEFISVANDTAVYIQCANDCIWDFNTIAPEGIQDIDISFKSWDGNNVQIKNMAFVNPLNTVKHFGIRIDVSRTDLFEMKNINFINFYVNNNRQSQTADTAFIIINGHLHIKNCKFSGYIMKGTIFSVDPETLTSQSNEPIFMNCSFNFNCRNNTAFYVGSDGRNINFNNCNFIFDGKCLASSTFSTSSNNKPSFNNCKFSGRIPFCYWRFNSDTTVFDVYVAEDLNLTFQGSVSDTLINSTKYVNQTQIPSTFKQVTTSQMTDISYLQSIGFPVVEV